MKKKTKVVKVVKTSKLSYVAWRKLIERSVLRNGGRKSLLRIKLKSL